MIAAAIAAGLLLVSGVPTYAVWAAAGGQVFWNRHEADLFLNSRTSGWRGTYGELAVRLAVVFVGGRMPAKDQRLRSFVVRCTADGIKTYETEGVFFGALTVFEGRIQAGAQWVWTGSEFVHATQGQPQRFVAAQPSSAAAVIENGGWLQQMLFRGLSDGDPRHRRRTIADDQVDRRR